MPKVSIIITSYNQRTTLELLLESLERQTEKDFDVIVADDGSSDGTDKLVGRQWGFAIRMVTQEDRGYRKAKILNQAIRVAKSDYLVFLDGDVVLEKHFLQDHLALRAPGTFVCGRRVDLGAEISKSITIDRVKAGTFDRPWPGLILSGLKKDTRNFNRGFRITNPIMRKILKYDRPMDLLGSNFGIWKKDLVAVNGFNEAFESYWGEDGDLFVRLRNSGMIVRGVKCLCVQFHVFHPRREPNAESVAKYQELLKDRTYKQATRGLAESAD